MLLELISHFEKVYIAQTEKEKEEVFRLRYQVYVTELNKSNPANVDHEKKWIRDPEDDLPGTLILYTRSGEEVSGTMRLDIIRFGDASETKRAHFSLKKFPLDADVMISELGRLIISRKYRGLMILPALAKKSNDLHFQLKVKYSFQYCAPGLVNHYRKMGFRPYSGDLIFTSDGVRIPMIFVLSDYEYLIKERSPLSRQSKTYYKNSGANDLFPIRNILRSDNRYILKKEIVWQELQERISGESDSFSFLNSLSEETMRIISDHGLILEIPPRKRIFKEDLVEEEIALVLEGLFEEVKNDIHISLLEKGDLFGELSLFLDSKKRTTDVYSITRGKILIIRRKFLDEMRTKNPKLANELLFNFCRHFASRLANQGFE